MKKFYSIIITLTICMSAFAQSYGWPDNYKGVMLQGFSWDSYTDTQWSNIESQADELSQYFKLIWVPQSGNCNTSGNVMGYIPVYYFNQNSSFGSETQLRSMINTFKNKGTGIIADVVVNHRGSLGVNSSWVDFPAEIYNGTTYQMTSTDITSNDDGGATYSWANPKGISLSSRPDEGEDFGGARDLDHGSSNVQNVVKAYTKYLISDLGYTGFRYDMVKGFYANHVGDYNDNAGVQYSVGEFWDSNDNISNWISYTRKTGSDPIRSAAFDFQFRYAVRDAINNSNWALLSNPFLAGNNYSGGYFKRYAVTFVENHDMQYRSASAQQDPIRRDTLAANAFLLAMPGTPCVFLPHWKAYKQEIKSMIDARYAVGISNTSNYTEMASSAPYYTVSVNGSSGDLLAVVGSGASSYSAPSSYVELFSGYHYRYFASKSNEMVFANKASGKYDNPITVKLIAVSNDANAKIVYTLDGSTPTASSNPVSSGTQVAISSTATLTLGLLSNGVVSKIITRSYVIQPFVAHTATVYFKDPGWASVYFYAWDNVGTLNGAWPGTVNTTKTTINGQTWYYKSFNITSSSYSFNIIFNIGSNQTQTVDIGPITEDKYYELGAMNGTKYYVNDVTSSNITGIENVNMNQETSKPFVNVYSIDGRKLRQAVRSENALQDLNKGIYIVDGKKYVVK